MADRQQHLDQVAANRAHANWLVQIAPDDPTAMQWAVVAAFYSALHCVEAHLADRELSTQGHVERRARMADPRAGIPPDVYAYYAQLEDWSRQARYQSRAFRSGLVQHTILARHLRRLTQFVGLSDQP